MFPVKQSPGILFAVTVLSWVLAVGPAAASPPVGASVPTRHVLVLYSQDGLTVPAYRTLHEAMTAVFEAGSKERLYLFNECLDLSLFPAEVDQRRLAEFYRIKYTRTHVDVVVAVTLPALRFALQHRETAFAGLPVVFCLLSADDLSALGRSPNVTGVALHFDIGRTIEIAGKIQPGLKHLAVVAGTGPTDRYLVPVARRAFTAFEGQLEWMDLTGLPMGDLLERVSRLPASTAILFLTLEQDGAGNQFVSLDAQQTVSRAANAPLYNFIDISLGYGNVGGCMASIEASGGKAAELVLRVLSGEKAGDIEPVILHDNPVLFNWDEMRRWGIAESALPPGSIVRFKKASLWETYKWWLAGVISFLMVQSVLIVGMAINLSRRKRAEADLRLSEANLKSTQNVARIGGFIFDIPHDALTWAQGAQQVFGVPAGSKLGYTEFLRLVHPDDREYVDAIWQAALEGSPFDTEYRVVIDTHTRWIKSMAEVEVDRRGRPRFVKGIVQDISERKKSEENAARLRHDLAHMARVSTVGELSQNLAHEVNQPLAAIVVNAEAALRLLAEPEPDVAEVREALGDIVADQKRARDVVQRIRALVKKDRPVQGPVDLNRVAQDAVKMIQGDATARKTRILLDLDTDLPPVWGDKVQLQQVVINLLLNALEAMDGEGSEPHRITVKTGGEEAGRATLTVSDTGSGIDAETLGRLFEPFFTTKPQGMGLGLSISRSIIEAHGGSVSAAANDGRGTTFRIGLTAVSPECAGGQTLACPRTGF